MEFKEIKIQVAFKFEYFLGCCTVTALFSNGKTIEVIKANGDIATNLPDEIIKEAVRIKDIEMHKILYPNIHTDERDPYLSLGMDDG